MNINEQIIDALYPLGLPIAEGLYEGDEDEFITFNLADSRAEDFGDNQAQAVVYYLHIHYVCPWEDDYSGKVRQIRQMLSAADFTYPELTDASDYTNRIRHIVLECATENNYDLAED